MNDKIIGMRVHRVTMPTRAVHSHGSGDVLGINAALVELSTEGGLTGWGEASPWPVFTGTLEGAVAALDTHMRPVVMDRDPVQIEALMNEVDQRLVGHTEAKAALETALLDLTGQIAGLSIAELLGGRQREAVPLSFSIANPDFDKDLADVAEMWADGVRLYKLKTGFTAHSFDLMRLEKLREIYGDEIDLRIDYNQGLNAYDAIRICRDLEAFRPTLIEQPVKGREWEAMAEITRAIDTPIMADESVFDPGDAVRAANARIADIFSLKIMKAGGLRRAMEVAAIARTVGIEVYGGCMFETSIAHAAGAHLVAAVPNLVLGCEFYMSTYYAADDLAQEPFPVSGGKVHVPTGPGLGVRPDAEKLEKYRTALLG